MNWINLNTELPTYYILVDIKLKTGEIIEAWRASTGEYNIWTKINSNKVYYDNAIDCWSYKNE